MPRKTTTPLTRREGVAPFATMSRDELLTCGDETAAGAEFFRRQFNKQVDRQSA